MKKIILRLCAFAVVCAMLSGVLFTAMPARAAEPGMTVYASLPWLSGMARFIVGTTIKIQSASAWNSSGELRIPRKLSKNSTVIALDPQDASRFGLVRGEAGLYILYENLPIDDSSRGALPFNPSVLPFLSQRMLKVLCELNPDNYSFYQRRIAEFQSRLESAVEVGRSLIREIPILDLTGAVDPWLHAASAKVVRPPGDLWGAWAGSTRTQELAMAVREAESRGWWILTDAWTPAPIKARVTSSSRCIVIAPPEADYDFFTYLHDIYLQIWTRASAK